jgi:predicted phosphodiesterase
MVLHGHSHDIKQYSRKGIYFINAGGSIENDSDNLFFFLIEYKSEDFNVTLENVPMKMNLIHQPTI